MEQASKMIRILLVEDDALAAEVTARVLQKAGVECACERVESEAGFRAALATTPDIILSDSNVPGFDGMAALSIARHECPSTPFVFVSGSPEEASVQRALNGGAAGYVSKADLTDLPTTVRSALDRAPESRRARDQRKGMSSPADASDTAEYLLERQAVLDRTLRQQDRSAMSNIMRRMPPSPLALTSIESRATRERYVKLLRNANIELEEAETTGEALARLEQRVHAVLFTDRLDLVRETRQLRAGAATHIVFVNGAGEAGYREALRAGANDCMPEEPRGEDFWTHLTTARRIVSLAASLQLALTDNRILSTIDELTRCGSRRFFEQQFPREVERAVRLGRPLALVTCDIDYFKRINDSHGHTAGDQVLGEFADRLTHGLRLGEDWVARIGGEEFSVVLPETAHAEAQAVAERLRERIAATPFATSSLSLPVTASFGVCGLHCKGGDTAGLAEAIVMAADAALYESKRGGRNRVTAAPYRTDVFGSGRA
jgi:two-component system cell cycle response regulator